MKVALARGDHGLRMTCLCRWLRPGLELLKLPVALWQVMLDTLQVPLRQPEYLLPLVVPHVSSLPLAVRAVSRY